MPSTTVLLILPTYLPTCLPTYVPTYYSILDKVFFKNGPTPASFSLIFIFSNTHYNFTTNKCENCPSSIRCQDLNSQPLEHGPGLPPSLDKVKHWNNEQTENERQNDETKKNKVCLNFFPLENFGEWPSSTTSGTSTTTSTAAAGHFFQSESNFGQSDIENQNGKMS